MAMHIDKLLSSFSIVLFTFCFSVLALGFIVAALFSHYKIATNRDTTIIARRAIAMFMTGLAFAGVSFIGWRGLLHIWMI